MHNKSLAHTQPKIGRPHKSVNRPNPMHLQIMQVMGDKPALQLGRYVTDHDANMNINNLIISIDLTHEKSLKYLHIIAIMQVFRIQHLSRDTFHCGSLIKFNGLLEIVRYSPLPFQANYSHWSKMLDVYLFYFSLIIRGCVSISLSLTCTSFYVIYLSFSIILWGPTHLIILK